MKPFRRDAWGLIVSNGLPGEYDAAAHSKSDGILPFSPGQVESLHWELCHVKNPRGRPSFQRSGALESDRSRLPNENSMPRDSTQPFGR